jgi:hypothetical protein
MAEPCARISEPGTAAAVTAGAAAACPFKAVRVSKPALRPIEPLLRDGCVTARVAISRSSSSLALYGSRPNLAVPERTFSPQ